MPTTARGCSERTPAFASGKLSRLLFSVERKALPDTVTASTEHDRTMRRTGDGWTDFDMGSSQGTQSGSRAELAQLAKLQ